MDVIRTNSRPRFSVRAAHGPRGGQAAISLLFVLFAGALFALPFVREPDRPMWEREDVTRNTGVGRDVPFERDLGWFAEDFGDELGAELRETIQAGSEEYFGMRSEWLAATGALEMGRLPAGKRAYANECAGCHGETGNGSGPAATFLDPRPRNFRKGKFKFTTTEGTRPRPEDLFDTITRGLAGSAMPDFRLLSTERRNDIVEYVRFLSMKGEFEQTMIDIAWADEEVPDAAEWAQVIVDRWHPDDLITVYPGIPEPERTPESVARGREIYFDTSRANCVACHGPEGEGDGPSVTETQVIDGEEFEGIYDDWGYRVYPRNFQSGVFRAGQEGKDLYLTVSTGISGTPMASFGGVLSPQEIWDVIHFVESLSENGGDQ